MFFQRSPVSRTKREIMKEERKTGGKASSLKDKKRVFVSDINGHAQFNKSVYMMFDCVFAF